LVVVLTDETSVSDVLRRAGIAVGDLDRVNPPSYSRAEDGMTITIRRVVEETVVVQEAIPFERQTVPNDGMQVGEWRLIQSGTNGIAEVTYRITYEDGVEVSRSPIRSVLITPPHNEVVMVGSQGQLPTVTVNGTLAYISGGNAWIMRQNSANRRPLTLDGGVDGRVFELSGDGRRLLFTRSLIQVAAEVGGLATATPPQAISQGEPFNSLWVVLDTADPEAEPVRLDLTNILYADWVPGTERSIVYSTAEPRPGFPGWQANNDLWRAQISPTGAVVDPLRVLEPSGGGIYGWYGTLFEFSPDGITLAWAQPDAVGVLVPSASADQEMTAAPPGDEGEGGTIELPRAYVQRPLLSFAPRNAYEVVWVPSLAWSPQGEVLVATTHGPPLGTEPAEDSPVFNLTAVPPTGEFSVDLVQRAGMWAAAQFSPPSAQSSLGEIQIAYLEAVDPLDSFVSRYRLVVMDRDGSNRRVVFPPEGQPGLQAGSFTWSPDGRQIAVVHQGNIYLVDAVTGLAQQVTGDGFASSPRWTP